MLQEVAREGPHSPSPGTLCLLRRTMAPLRTQTFQRCGRGIFAPPTLLPLRSAPSLSLRLTTSQASIPTTTICARFLPRAYTQHAPPFFFPCQIDHRVPITSVGVDKFVLVQRGSTEAGASEGGAASGVPEGDVILLRLTIPQSSIAFRACEAGTAPQLTLTCYPHKEAGASNSFTVQLTGGGSAKPAEGVAAPSLQAQTDVFAATLAAPPE